MTSRGEHIRLEKGSIVKHHYEVVTSVGSGNFSKVYRVIDLELSSKEQRRRPLAMKVIKKEYSGDAKYEKQMLIALHKNDKNKSARVSKMHECFVYQECPVFIMPIHGPSIRSRRLGINRGIVTHEKLLEFAYDILETMDFVHFQCHMVHTDLKPENILIADCNVAENSMGNAWVVCDFGSASLWRLDKLDSDLISTRPYRAPEVVLGNKWHYAADMWSVGCILYEVAVGHRLFEIRDDLTHLHMMDRRVARLPEAFTKSSKYSSKFFNSRGEFLSTPDVIRFGKCRLTPLRDMFRDDKDFLHLLEGLFIYDPSRRMTATEALALPMFNAVRAARQRRAEREAEEAEQAEARRARRRAAAAAATATGIITSGTDSLMSTVNSAAGSANPRLTDRTDRNTLESAEETKKLPRAASGAATAVVQGSDAATSSADPAAGPSGTPRDQPSACLKQQTPDLEVASESRGTTSPLTIRSATDTTASRLSLHGSPAKESGKPRSTAGSASLRSTTESSSGAVAGHVKASGKPRSRAVSTPAAMSKGGSSSGISNTAVASSMAPSTSAAGVVIKEAPRSHRPVVEHRRGSTGSAVTPASSTTTTTTTIVVPKLALGKLSGSDAPMNAAGVAPTLKATRTAGDSTVSRSAKHFAGPLEHKPAALRTVSPAEGSSSAGATGAKSKRTSSHTPRKVGRSSRRDNAVSVNENASSTTEPNAMSDSPSVVPHAPDASMAGGLAAPRMGRVGGTAAIPSKSGTAASHTQDTVVPSGAATRQHQHQHQQQQHPQTRASAIVEGSDADKADGHPMSTHLPSVPHLESPVAAAAASPTATPVRAPPTTLLGYQSPLERGMTAAGITTRTEPPVGNDSPYTEAGEREVGERKTPGKGKEGRRVSDQSSDGDASEGKEGTTEASEGDASTFNSPSTTNTANNNPDGSPRATDYRSPVRHRAPAVTPTDDTSAPASPEASRRSTACTGTFSADWSTSPAASPTSASAGGPSKATGKAYQRSFPQTQPAPKLASAVPPSEGHRTPREVSPAPVTGRGNSPMATARRSQQQASAASEPTTALGSTHELASTVPIVRAPPSRGNSRSASLASTAVTTPKSDALTRTMAPATSSTAAVAAAQEGGVTQASYPVLARASHQNAVAPRASTAGPRPSLSVAITPSASAPTGSTTAASPSVGYSVMSPSMKPVINASAGADHRHPSVLTPSVADVRGPSAVPVSASRRTVVKPGPSASSPLPNAPSNASNGSSGIPEHPVSQPRTPLPSTPPQSSSSNNNNTGVPHLPEAVTRSRERSLAVDTTERERTAAAAAASRRGSANTPNLAFQSVADAATPKTPQPSANTGAVSLSSSLSLPSAPTHPALGVVRQRSGSTQLIPGHTTMTPASGLESNPAMSASQLGVYTPRGSRVLQEHHTAVSGRSSAALPPVQSGASTSPPPPRSSHGGGGGGGNGGSRLALSLATPTVVHDGEQHSSRYPDHISGVVTVDSRPTTPRGSGRASVKSLDMQQLHGAAPTAGGSGNARPPRSSMGGGGGPSPTAPSSGSGGKSPRYSGRLGVVASNHGGQAALNASTSSLHLGVTRSPRKPVAPGAAGNGTTSLMASVDGMSAVSGRSVRSSSRTTISPRGSSARKPPSKTASPRRAPLSPRTTSPTTAATAAAERPLASSEAPFEPLSLTTPAQPLVQLASIQAPARPAQPRRSLTVISSKPSSSAQLSRYSNVAAVAPTRTSALRPPPMELLASTGKLQPANGLGASHTSPVVSASTSSSQRDASLPSRLSATADGASASASGPEPDSASGPATTKYRRDARTLKRIVVSRPSPQSSGASMVSPQELGDDDVSSISPATSIT